MKEENEKPANDLYKTNPKLYSKLARERYRENHPDKFNEKQPWRIKEEYDSLPEDAIPIPLYPSYYACPDGTIWRDTINHPEVVVGNMNRIIQVKDRLNKYCGYHQAQLYTPGGKRQVKYVHRLVLSAFEGLPKKGMECHHLDNDTSNNHIDNLIWVTRLQNARFVPEDRRRVSRVKYAEGRKISQSRYSNLYPQVLELHNLGIKPCVIARQVNIKVASIYAVIRVILNNHS